MSSPSPPSLPYHEPSIPTLLTLFSFIFLLNALNSLLNDLVYCGLIAQILLGVAYGAPGAGLLADPSGTQGVVVGLGYLGLVGLVYEGGLQTDFATLIPNLALSTCVAITGISLPIALSYTLIPLCGATKVQAFAAGAALCSTSLGTTFTVLSSCGLVKTRMGVVLSTAAMLDDVVGLVLVGVITNLGSDGDFDAVTVVRPVFVSLAFVVCVLLGAWLGLRPVAAWVCGFRGQRTGKPGWVGKVMRSEELALTVQTLWLVGMVAGSSYAGTSNLFAAYLAGAVVSWWDSDVRPRLSPPAVDNTGVDRNTAQGGETQSATKDTTTGTHIFEKYYQPALQRILKPFFFASIGFSIPISQMFDGAIVWRGLVYSMLMFIVKLACGLWLVRLPSPSINFRKLISSKLKTKLGVGDSERREEANSIAIEDAATTERTQFTTEAAAVMGKQEAVQQTKSNPTKSAISTDDVDAITTTTTALHRSNESKKVTRQPTDPKLEHRDTATAQNNDNRVSATESKPVSLYPSIIVGGAMAARGEIGFLISSLAQSNGIFDPISSSTSSSTGGDTESSAPIFLVVTWAIMLCTVAGPLIVGTLVNRVKKLEARTTRAGGGREREKDVLGVWGVQ